MMIKFSALALIVFAMTFPDHEAMAQCQFTAAGCRTTIEDVLERMRQDRREENQRRHEREERRQHIDNYRYNQNRKVPGPKIIQAPKHGPGPIPE